MQYEHVHWLNLRRENHATIVLGIFFAPWQQTVPKSTLQWEWLLSTITYSNFCWLVAISEITMIMTITTTKHGDISRVGCRTSEVTLVLENLVFFSVLQTTHTQRATSVPSGWISRSGLWTWIPKPWNYRFGTRLGRTNPRHRVQVLSKFRVFACFGKMILK